MEIHNDKIREIYNLANDGKVYLGLKALQSFTYKKVVDPVVRDRLEEVLTSFDMMLKCYKLGMTDPKRDEIFDDIEDFLFGAIGNLLMYDAINNNSTLKAALKRGDSFDFYQFEDLVHEKHDDVDFLNKLFSAFLVCPKWDAKISENALNVFSNPNTDFKVAALMLSAIMLSNLIVFDLGKSMALLYVYENSSNAKLRQRAFVGWAFGMCCCPKKIMPTMVPIILGMCSAKGFIDDVVEMQKQIFFCLDAEKDGQTVDKSLLDPLKESDFTRENIFGLDDTSLNDILHPEQDDEKVERLEKAVANMTNMQKNGSDVYFGGFAQMKSFAFFHSLYNWFIPYYIDNPVLSSLLNSLDGNDKMLRNIQENSPFCESDKYSFSLAIDFSLKKSLAPIKEMLKEGFLFGNAPFWNSKDDEDAIDRRMYLQDLYRFYKLSPFKDITPNLFDTEKEGYVCFSAFLFNQILVKVRVLSDKPDFKIIYDEVKAAVRNICVFLTKRKKYRLLRNFLSEFEDGFDLDCDIFYALSIMYSEQDYKVAYKFLKLHLEKHPEDSTALKLVAKCACEEHLYEEACGYYEKLQELKPSDSIRLKHAFCLLKCEKSQSALKILFELNYKYPDNEEILRSLAWGKVLQGDYEDAIKRYDNLADKAKNAQKDIVLDDIYNKGICYWLLGNKVQTVSLFCEYLSRKTKEDPALEKKLSNDAKLFKDKGVGLIDLRLMLECVMHDFNNKDSQV